MQCYPDWMTLLITS
uniref:Uncharacterized protein n=1 Tax=Anguilla anguilla TaxID=7936 RepID=A0A0E9QLU9_ANGAN